MRKKCVVCGGVFEARNSRHKTCSPVCSRENRLAMERSRQPVGSRAKPKPVCTCEVCRQDFTARRSDARFCSPQCHYAAKAEIRRERCRSWRKRHPDRQAASTKRWQENNRDLHLEAQRKRHAKWRAENPEAKAAESREYRRRSPRPKQYQAERTAAYQLVRAIEKHGVNALSAEFCEPPASVARTKARAASRRWKDANPDYTPPRDIERQREAQRAHQYRKAAALKLIREIETKGLEALL